MLQTQFTGTTDPMQKSFPLKLRTVEAYAKNWMAN
jgi:hypothetical protein